MIRLTFITGAGKLARQKYDEGAAKALTSALRALGFEDDSSASCIPQCAGTFKLQHDTGKNLKTVVVFPKISGSSRTDDADVRKGVEGMTVSSILPPGSPEHTCAVLSNEAFAKMLETKCQSWSQKKGCLHALSTIVEKLQDCDKKLLSGQPLSDEEQDLYNTISLDSLQKKEAYVKKQIQDHVEERRITKLEKQKLVEQCMSRLNTLSTEIAEAKKDNKPKKVEKLSQMKEKAEARRTMLERIDPIEPHRLKHEPEIIKLRVEMRPLLKLEASAKGRLLTVKETTALGRKDEILQEIEELEDASRGWFEEDDIFNARVKASRDAAKLKEKQYASKSKQSSNSSGTAGGGYKAKPMTGWSTTTTMKKSAPRAAPSRSTGTGGGVFSAMMMDSDSD